MKGKTKQSETKRGPYQKKESCAGHKSARGKGECGSEKKNRLNITLEPSTIDIFKRAADHTGFSISKIINQIGKGKLNFSVILKHLETISEEAESGDETTIS